jgi:hypothetical protein
VVKPTLLFVHGIGGPRRVDDECFAWVTALAEGMVRAGHSRLAENLGQRSGFDIRFAYYQDLFADPNAQGGDDTLDDVSAAILRDLVDEVLAAQLAEDTDEQTAAALRHALSELRPADEEQGSGDIVRRILNAATTLLSIGPLAKPGQWLSARLLVRDLAQVARYLGRREPDESGTSLDVRIRDRVRAAMGDGPTIVVAHSLGSVVAFEALHDRSRDVPLLVTLGSPLGMRAVVWPRLRPAPPRTPGGVERWLNFWDRDDIIVARPRLERDVLPNALDVVPVSRRVDSDGVWVHTATKYLAKADVGGPVAETLEELIAPAAR